MKYTVDNFAKQCGCRTVDECWPDPYGRQAEISALKSCAIGFMDAMQDKLIRKIGQKHGWDDPDWPMEDLIAQLKAHIDKGDWVDVANFAMFAWNKKEN